VPDPITHPRQLSEQEFTAIRDRLLQQAPAGMSETDFHNWIAPRLAFELGKAEAMNATPEGGPVGRFFSNAGDVLNPAALVSGLYNAVRHPVDTAAAIGNASLDQGRKATEAAKLGRVSEAVGHGLGTFPLVGPAVAQAGEQLAEGDIGGGLGRSAGLLIPMAGPAAVRSVGRAVRAAAPEGVATATANALERGAAARVEDVIAPKVGANKTRFGNMAADVAPDLAKNPDLTAWSREGFHGKVGEAFAAAEQNLDAVADARLSARTFETKPIIDALMEKRKALTAESVEASDISTPRGVGAEGKPLGRDVVPAPNAARVAELDRAIAEIKQLGPVARYEPIRRIRQAYDGPAKAVYNPSMTQDFLKAQGGKLGAADVTGVLREQLAKWDPQTAQANAPYSLMRTANDVLDATAEVERTRPKVGRRIIARLTGTILGEQAGGPVGAVAGYALGPTMDAVAGSGWTTQLKTAQLMSKLAKAIRNGDEGAVISTTATLKRLGAQVSTLTGNATSPSGSQNQTTASAR
jgi:hypothetical protein